MLPAFISAPGPRPGFDTGLGGADNLVYHAMHDPSNRESIPLASQESLNRFLSGVDRRAFRMAELATGNADVALDIVQDAMLALVSKYRDRPESEWGPLFHRILQSKVRDWYRRSSVRNRIMGWLHIDDDNEADPLQQLEDERATTPEQVLEQQQTADSTLAAVRRLPLRQQQTFLLRAWEGYSVQETAQVMGCSEGSVKTHYSRAIASLKSQLQDDLHASA